MVSFCMKEGEEHVRIAPSYFINELLRIILRMIFEDIEEASMVEHFVAIIGLQICITFSEQIWYNQKIMLLV